MSVLPLIVDFVTEKKNEYDGTSSKSIQNQEISQNDNTDIDYNFNALEPLSERSHFMLNC